MSSENEVPHQSERYNTIAQDVMHDRLSIITRIVEERSQYIPNFTSFHVAISACDEVLFDTNKQFERELKLDYFTDLSILYYDLLAFHRILKVMQQTTHLSDSQRHFLFICKDRFEDFKNFSVDAIAAFYLKQLAPSNPDDPMFGLVTPYLPPISANPFSPANGHQWSLDYVQRLPNVIATIRKIYRSRVGIYGNLTQNSDYSLDYNLTTESAPTAASVSVRPGTGSLISMYAPINPSTGVTTPKPFPPHLHGFRISTAIPHVPYRSDTHVFDSEADFFRINEPDRFIEKIHKIMERRNAYFKQRVLYGSLGYGETHQSKIIHHPTMPNKVADALNGFLDELVDVPTLTPALPASSIVTAATATTAAQSSRRAIYAHCKSKKLPCPFDYSNLMERLQPFYSEVIIPHVAGTSLEASTPEIAFIETTLSLWNLKSLDLFPFHSTKSSTGGIFYTLPLHHATNSFNPHSMLVEMLSRNHIPRA